MKCEVRSAMCSAKCEVRSAKCEVRSAKCEARSAKREVRSAKWRSEEGSHCTLEHQVELNWAPALLLATNLHARCCCASLKRARDIPVASTSLVSADIEAHRKRLLALVVTNLANVSTRVKTSRLVCSSLGQSCLLLNSWEPQCVHHQPLP